MFFVSQSSKRILRFTFLFWFAVFVGIFLWSRDWEVVRLASTKQKEDLFGLFAFCVFCVMTFALYLDVRARDRLSAGELLLLGLPYLVGLIFLAQTTELSFGSWDYDQYEAAFRAIAEGGDPYLGTRYLYPPLFADMMAFVFRIGLRFFSYVGMDKSAWVFVFYVHQASLLYFLLLSYFLSFEFAKQIGLANLRSVILVSVIYLFNVPVLRTLSNNQVNFYILASILLVLVLLRKYPFIAGLAAAVGGMIKIYPFALSAPMVLLKKWRAIFGLFAGSLLVIFFETNFFRNFELWRQFINFYRSFPVEQESLLFRNSSPMSFLRSTLGFLNLPDTILRAVFVCVVASVGVWYLFRFLQRERMAVPDGALRMDTDFFRMTGHMLDFSVISLLIAPSAWEHHYVIAIPLAIWTFTLRGRDAFLQTTIGTALVFALPVFNVYPFSYLRMAGLLILLLLVSPKNIEKTFSISVHAKKNSR